MGGEDENVSEIESKKKEDTENGPMEVPTELDKNLDSDEVLAEDVSGENRKRKQQEDIETVSPEKKRPKNPGTAQPKRSTRSASEKIPKAKETAGRTNRGKIEENCIVCVGEKAAYVGATRKNGHVWLSLCDEFIDVLEDRKVMEEVKGVLMRAKTKKDSEKIKEKEKEKCGICSEKFKGTQTSLVCIRCNRWIHLKCTKYSTGREAEKNKSTFNCDKCSVLTDYYNSEPM